VDSGMAWLRRIGIAFAVLMGAAVAGLACGDGDGGGEVDLSGVDAVVGGALRAISPPGEVGHLTSADESRVQEMWVDADNGRFRSESRPVEGEEGWSTVTVGEDWRIATYQSDMESFPIHITAVDREELAERGMDNLAYLGAEYLSYLAGADERRVVGESTVDGREVVVIEARQAMDGDWQPGTVMVVTVELDKATLLPVQLRSKIIEPDGTETEEYGGPPQFEWDTVSPDDLPPDFFSPDALFALYSPVDEKLAQASKLDFSLFWLSEKYEGAAQGQLDLYLWDVKTEGVAWPELHYASETLGSGGEVVLIREGPVGQVQFGPPPEMTGPIEEEQVTVQGRPATLYFKTDRLSPTYEVTYHWLVLTLGGTTIELYPVPMSEEGQEIDPLNNREALLALAEALVPVAARP
jgi:hypothetical protein